MSAGITVIAKNFLNLIYPLRCAACGKDIDALNEFGVCEFCIGNIRRNPKPYCKSCGRSIEKREAICPECQRAKHHFKTAYSSCLYEGVVKELIHLFKYNGKLSVAKILSKVMMDFIKENGEVTAEIDIITFVPLEVRRSRKRGFNQSKILAFGLSKEFGLPILDTLVKTRPTPNQNELSRNERLANLKDVFRAKESVGLESMKILLVDDVMTTGATLNECSRALLGAGAKEVRCFTLARG